MKAKILILLHILVFNVMYAQDFTPFKKRVFSLISENDAYMPFLDLSNGYPDRYYTAGTAIAYKSSEMDLDSLKCNKNNECHPYKMRFIKYIDALYFLKSKRFSAYSIMLTQKLYTPKDTDDRFNRKDRPYAGTAFFSFGVHHRFENMQEIIRFDIGTMGTLSLDEQTQAILHNQLKTGKFYGWKHQLRDVIYLNLNCDYLYRFYIFNTKFISSDVINNIQINIGNIETNASLSAILRVGYNLDSNFLANKITFGNINTSYNNRFFIYAFCGIYGKAIAFNELITGMKYNFNDLKINHLAYNLEYGFSMGIGGFSLTASANYQSKEFKTQIPSNDFGSISFNLAF